MQTTGMSAMELVSGSREVSDLISIKCEAKLERLFGNLSVSCLWQRAAYDIVLFFWACWSLSGLGHFTLECDMAQQSIKKSELGNKLSINACRVNVASVQTHFSVFCHIVENIINNIYRRTTLKYYGIYFCWQITGAKTLCMNAAAAAAHATPPV